MFASIIALTGSIPAAVAALSDTDPRAVACNPLFMIWSAFAFMCYIGIFAYALRENRSCLGNADHASVASVVLMIMATMCMLAIIVSICIKDKKSGYENV